MALCLVDESGTKQLEKPQFVSLLSIVFTKQLLHLPYLQMEPGEMHRITEGYGWLLRTPPRLLTENVMEY